jgi:hypothetical protein
MSKYLLTCDCGSTVPVEIGQAGGKVACPACGAALDVPTLRKLRHLPPAGIETRPVPSSWGARQGVATAGLILAAILATVAAGSRYFEPTVPEFNPDARRQSVDRALETMTPVQGFQMWVDLYRPLAERGFAIIEDPHKPAIEQYIAKQRFFQKTLLIVAAISAAVAVAAALWPRPMKTRRQ